MHEASIVETTIQQAIRELENTRIQKITHLYLRIGNMHHLRPQTMIELFNMMKADFPPLHETRLHIENVPVLIRCNSCASENQLEELFFTCPQCGSVDVKLLSGDELLLLRIEGTPQN